MGNFENPNSEASSFLIADWHFEPATCQLQKDDVVSKLEPLLCDFLQYLISRAGETVAREDLLEHVWQGRVVSDDAIRRVVKKLRLALGDDAKNPRYIKTKPLQGYVLVAELKSLKKAKPKNPKTTQLRWVLAIAIVGLIAALLFQQLATPKPVKLAHTPGPQQTALTSLTGSELGGDFHPASQQLLFTLRNNTQASLALYTKNLNSSFVQKISQGEGHFYHGLFSPSGKQIAYSHQSEDDKNSFMVIADYDPNKGLSKPQKIDIEGSAKAFSSWSANGKALYFFTESSHKEPWEIYRYQLDSKSIEQITYSSKQGYGAFYAKESPDGRYLAILKNVFGRRYAITLMDLSDNSLVAERNLSFFGDSVLWLKPDSRVSGADGSKADLVIGSFKGDLYYYSIKTDSLWEQTGTEPGLNDVFYDCGARCFYMRRHTMDYTDLVEIPNPFIEISSAPTLQLESSKAEFHPIYNKQATALFYTQKDEQSAAIVKHPFNKPPQILHTFNPRHIIREMVLSPDQRYLTGRIEDRLFILNIESLDFKYLSSELEMVAPPSWSRDGKQIFFSRLKEDRSDLYAYQLADSKTVYKEGNTAYLKQLADGRNFVIDHDLKLYQLEANGQRQYIRQFVQQFVHLSGSTWKVQGEFLYFSELSHGNTYLVQHNLNNGKQRRQLLAKNSSSWEFDIHPDGDRLLLARFQTADSDLVKVQWPQP